MINASVSVAVIAIRGPQLCIISTGMLMCAIALARAPSSRSAPSPASVTVDPSSNETGSFQAGR